MTTNGTLEMVENDTPDAASNVGQRRVSVDSAGALKLTDYLGVTTPVGGGGGSLIPVLLTDADNGMTLVPGHLYYVFNTVPATFYLPAAAGAVGAGDIEFTAPAGVEVLLQPQPTEMIIDLDGLVTATALDGPNFAVSQTLYRFKSWGSIAGPGIWIRVSAIAAARRYIDVSAVTVEPLPAYTVSGGPTYQRLTANVAGPLIVDGVGPFIFSALIGVFFGDTGIYQVINPGDGLSPWVLEMQSSASDGFASSATRVRVLDGNYGHDREFFIGPRTREAATPLLFSAVLPVGPITQPTWPGKIDKIDPSAGLITLNLYSDPGLPALQDGMRYGIKALAAGAAVTITPTVPAQIEDPNTSVVAASTTFAAGFGLQVIWQYDANGDVWRLAP